MFGRNFWWHRPPQKREYEFSVVTESFLTGGTQSVEVGTSFTYEGSDATLSVRDNDKKMAGDAWRNERGTDTQPGTLTTNSGDTVDAGNIYAERYLIVRDSNGRCYTMIEIEGTNLSNDPAQDDVFAFYGAVPAPGAELTVLCAGNVWFGVKYNALNGGPAAIILEAVDDALTVDMDAVASVNLLANDKGDDAVIASFAGTSLDASGGPVMIEVDGIAVTINPDGQITIDPQSAAGGIALLDGETLDITFSYTITDGTNTSEAVLTLTLEGVNDAPELAGLSPVLDNFTLQEQQDGEIYSVDLNAYFSDPDGDTLTLTSDNLPAGFQIVDGVLGLDGTEVAHGEHTITVTATDTSGASLSTDLTFIAALNLSSDDQFRNQDIVLDGTEIADSVEYTALSTFFGGSLDLDLKGGDDVLRAGTSFGASGTVDIDTGAGNDTVELGVGPAETFGTFTLQTGSGDDNVTVGDRAAFFGGEMVIETDTGADTITFGQSAATSGGSLTVNAGADDDTITFGKFAAVNGAVAVDAGSGADMISFASFGRGSQQLQQAGTITIDLGDDTDRDVLSFENLGNVTVQNWTQGEDAAITVADPTLYIAREENGNTIFESEDGLQTMVVEGVTGVPFGEILEGYNYAPTVAGPIVITDAVSEDDGPLQVDLLEGATDPDGDTLSATDVVATYVNGTGQTVPVPVSVDATGVATIDPAQFNALGEGDSAEVTITFDVTDPSGRSVSNTATVTISGANDGPTISAEVTASATEDGGVVVVDLLQNASDADAGTALDVAGITGLPDGVTLDGTTLRVDPGNAAFQALAEGEQLELEIAYQVVDDQGASVDQTATITVIGSNDAASISGDVTGAVVEDGEVLTPAKLTAGDGAALDLFGTSSSVSADGSTIVVGAGLDDDKGRDSGSAYVFNADGTQLAKLTADDGAANNIFGESISVSADGDTIVVGAVGADQGSFKGSAYVFDRDGDRLAKLTASDGAANDQFGSSISVSADGNTIVVGASRDSGNGNGSDSGSAYTFGRNADGNFVDFEGNIYGPDGVIGTQTLGGVADIVTGTLTIEDADAGEAALQEIAAGTEGENGYGSFEVLADGTWTYTLDNSRPAVQALAEGQEVTDKITVTSVDGSASQVITVTVAGSNDGPELEPITAQTVEAMRVSGADSVGAAAVPNAGWFWALDFDTGALTQVARTTGNLNLADNAPTNGVVFTINPNAGTFSDLDPITPGDQPDPNATPFNFVVVGASYDNGVETLLPVDAISLPGYTGYSAVYPDFLAETLVVHEAFSGDIVVEASGLSYDGGTVDVRMAAGASFDNASDIVMVSGVEGSFDAILPSPDVLITPVATDLDGDVLTASVDDSATLGDVTLNADGTVTYNAGLAFAALAAGEFGTDSFIYTVDDGNGGTATQTAEVTILGDGPATVTSSATALTPNTGQEVTVTLAAESTTTDGTTDVEIDINFGAVVQPQINVVYVVDTSGSTGASVLDQEKAALVALTEEIAGVGYADGSVSISLVPFSTTVAPDRTGDDIATFTLDNANTSTIETAISDLSAGGFTNYVEALNETTSLLTGLDPNQEETNIVYFLSDGRAQDENGLQTIPEVSAAAVPLQEIAQVNAYEIGTFDALDFLNAVDNTGGTVSVENPSDLSAALIGSPIPEGTVLDADVFIFDDSETFGTLVEAISIDVPGGVDDPNAPNLVATPLGLELDLSVSDLATSLGDQNRVTLVVQFDDNDDGIVDLPLFVEVDVFGLA